MASRSLHPLWNYVSLILMNLCSHNQRIIEYPELEVTHKDQSCLYLAFRCLPHECNASLSMSQENLFKFKRSPGIGTHVEFICQISTSALRNMLSLKPEDVWSNLV